MANPLRGEVTLEAGGRTYTMRLGSNAVVEAETVLGLGVQEIAELLADPATFRLGTARALLWAALREHHPDLDLAAVGNIIDETGIASAVAAIGEAMTAAFPVADGKSRPPKASQAGTGATS